MGGSFGEQGPTRACRRSTPFCAFAAAFVTTPADFVYFASTADRQTPADRRSSGGRDFAAALPLLVA
jgi:hypothetical protein